MLDGQRRTRTDGRTVHALHMYARASHRAYSSLSGTLFVVFVPSTYKLDKRGAFSQEDEWLTSIALYCTVLHRALEGWGPGTGHWSRRAAVALRRGIVAPRMRLRAWRRRMARLGIIYNRSMFPPSLENVTKMFHLKLMSSIASYSHEYFARTGATDEVAHFTAIWWAVINEWWAVSGDGEWCALTDGQQTFHSISSMQLSWRLGGYVCLGTCKLMSVIKFLVCYYWRSTKIERTRQLWSFKRWLLLRWSKREETRS